MSGKSSFVGFVCLFVWGGVEYRAEAVFLGGGLRGVWVLGGGGDRIWELGIFIYWPYFGSVKVCAELRGLWISSVFSSGKIHSVLLGTFVFHIHPYHHFKSPNTAALWLSCSPFWFTMRYHLQGYSLSQIYRTH